MSFAFPPGYGYCFAVLGASCFMNFYLVVNVVMARKKYDIQYPAVFHIPLSDRIYLIVLA